MREGERSPSSAKRAEARARSRQRRLSALRFGMRTLGAVSPALAARAAEKLFRTPPRHVPWDGEHAVLGEGRRVVLSVRGLPVAAWTWGRGEPVLLAHGWGSTGGRLGSFVPPLLAAGYSVVAFDAPGHGETGGRRSSLPEIIFSIEAAHAAYGPFAGIIGHSLGGASVTLAVGRGVSSRRTVLLAATGDPAGYTKRFAELLGVAPAIRERMEASLVRQFGMQWPEFDVVAAARRATSPALVIHDADDAEIPWSDGAAVAKAWPGAELVTTHGLGHTRIVHDPDVVARAVAFVVTGDR